MKNALIVLVVLVIIALLLGSSFVSRRNQMVVKREAVNAAWARSMSSANTIRIGNRIVEVRQRSSRKA